MESEIAFHPLLATYLSQHSYSISV